LAESPSSFLTSWYLGNVKAVLLAGCENKKYIFVLVLPTLTIEKVSDMACWQIWSTPLMAAYYSI